MSFNVEVDGGKSVRLPTAGKYCDRDIVVTAKGESIAYPVADKPETIGQMACLARAAQFRDIEMTPVGPLVCWGNTYSAGDTIKGIPYSSTRDTDKFVGFNVSLDTYLTALHNPKSVLYTKQAQGISNAKVWYGMNCSVYVCYCWDMFYHTATAMLPFLDCVEEVDPADMKLCDAGVATLVEGDMVGHAVLITGIERDENGNVAYVTISHSTSHVVLDGLDRYLFSERMTYDTFVSRFIDGQGYGVYRYKNLYDTRYEPSKYIPLFDEPVAQIVYSDLSTDLGDKATIRTDETITLQPLKTTGYTEIVLYKDGEEIGVYPVADKVLSGLEAGKYVAKMGDAETSFIVCDVSATYEGTRYSFSGVGGTPVRVVFKDSQNFTLHTVDLTEDDVVNGYKDITYSNASIAKVCIPFRNEYGFVVKEGVRAKTSRLPDGYQEVQYIETDGKQYIDTGINASNYSGGISYEFRGNATGITGSDTDYLFGASANGVRSGNVNISPSQIVLLIGATGNDILQRVKPANGADFTLVVGNTSSSISTIPSATVNGEELIKAGNPISTGTMPDANIWLLACNGITGETRRFYGKLYSFKMTDANGALIRDFVPCYRASDNVIGLYDLVGGTFYTNAGAGSLIAGEEV